jgi:hypothetical protein
MPESLVPLTPFDVELTDVMHAAFKDAGRDDLCHMSVKLAAQDSGATALALIGHREGGYPPEDEPVVRAAMGAVMAHLEAAMGLPPGDEIIRGPRSWNADNTPAEDEVLRAFSRALGIPEG